MPELTPDIAAEVVAACQAGAAEVAAALSRALDGQFEVTIGEAVAYDAQQPPAGLDGPGLAVVLRFGEVGAAVVLPESTGLLPDWYVKPDASGQSKLDTLAQELSMLVMPERLAADQLAASSVNKLTAALTRGKVAAEARLVPLRLKSGKHEGQLSLIWPVSKPAEIILAAEAVAVEASDASSPEPDDIDVSRLPPYERSLFKIKVPVTVTLATQRKSIQEIIELGPGSIVKFDKTCDELLQLIVGSRTLAEGEVVKVGDKFGLRISNMVRPEEHFAPLRSP
jgi:flagellar motor switch protein FliN/FliY